MRVKSCKQNVQESYVSGGGNHLLMSLNPVVMQGCLDEFLTDLCTARSTLHTLGFKMSLDIRRVGSRQKSHGVTGTSGNGCSGAGAVVTMALHK